MACKKNTTNSSAAPTNQIAVPNGGFENWNTQLRPLNWYTNGCPLCQGAPFDEYVVRRDTQNICSGSYSAQFYYNWNFQAYAKNKFAIANHPTYLQAYVKDTMLSSADSVLIKVDVFYQKHHVDSGIWVGTSPIKTFTILNIPISQNTTHADTVIITIRGQCFGRPYSSSLWVDNVSLFK
jgi:hypothetical protein